MNVLVIEASLPLLRATLLDESGTALGSALQQIPVASPAQGVREAAAEEIHAGLLELVREVVSRATVLPSLVTVTGMSGGLWLTSRESELVRPAILGDDARAGDLLDSWIDAGISAAAFRRSGSAPDTGSLVTLLRQLEIDEPDTLDRAAVAAGSVPSLFGMLAASATASAATAPHHLVDPHHRKYDEELVDLYRLRHWRHLLPSLDHQPAPFDPCASLDELRSSIHPEALVHAGSIDITAMLTGAGIQREGGALVHLGRTLDCVVLSSRFDTETEPAGITMGSPHGMYWIRALSGASGMTALDWFLNMTGHNYQELNGLIADAPPGANGTMAIPVISTSGERSPYVDSRARGRLIGISAATTNADLARALAEGIAFAARHALESAGLRRDATVTFCGSGVRAPAFRQLLADVLGRTLLIGPHPEPAAYGAAMEAMNVAGIRYDIDAWRGAREDVHPASDTRNLYDEAYDRYRREVAHAREVML